MKSDSDCGWVEKINSVSRYTPAYSKNNQLETETEQTGVKIVMILKADVWLQLTSKKWRWSFTREK